MSHRPGQRGLCCCEQMGTWEGADCLPAARGVLPPQSLIQDPSSDTVRADVVAEGTQNTPRQRGDFHTGPDPSLATTVTQRSSKHLQHQELCPSFWQSDAKTSPADKDGCSGWKWYPKALEMAPWVVPHLSVLSVSDCAENNTSEASTTNPDHRRSTKGTERSICEGSL